MITRVNSTKKKPHFAFKIGYGGNENSGGGESIEHQLSKKVIYDLKYLNIKIGDKLEFSEIIIEKPFVKGLYRTDLYCKIKTANKFYFPVGYMFAVELHYTNKVKKSKQKFYRDNNIASIEIDIWKKIKFVADIEQLQRQLIGYFKKQNFAKRLHDPNWKRRVQERKNKKQQEIEAERKRLSLIRQESENKRLLELAQKVKVPKVQPNIEIKVIDKKNITIPKKSFWKRIFDFIFK